MKNVLISLILVLVMSSHSFGNENIKQPNVSGAFYDSDAKELSEQITSFLDQADVEPSESHVGLIIAPHAGYVYSGPVAGYSFKYASHNEYSTVIILGPSHYYGFPGVHVLDLEGYQTPLGTATIDLDMARSLIAASPNIFSVTDLRSKVFEREHSVEVEIPFTQVVFKDAKIVPMIMGQMKPESLADVVRSLKEVIGAREDVLIVISSDMSHFHDGQKARELDLKAAETIQSLNPNKIWEAQQAGLTEIDGIFPIMAAVLYANNVGLKNADFLKYAHSGDITGDDTRVVGYTSFAFTKAKETSGNTVSALTLDQKRRLVEIARETVESYVKTGKAPEYTEADSRLLEEEGAFVTLHKKGRLRGCIGHILGDGPLYKTVGQVAVSAASADPRFQAVTEEELKDIDVEVSVLSKPWRIKDVNEIEMGKHGVIVSQGQYNRGLFLPQVADTTGWSREEFLSNLCAQKAGLKPDAWKDPKTVIEIFSADVFSEHDVKKDAK